MEPEEVEFYLDIADHAVRSLMRRMNLYGEVTGQDLDDMRQEALLRLLDLVHRRPDMANPDKRGYLFICARHAALAWAFWWSRGLASKAYLHQNRKRNSELKKKIRLLSLEELKEVGWEPRSDYDERDTLGQPLPPEYNKALFDIFLDARSKRGRRGMMAAIRDVRIVNCVVMGYSNEAIATELGFSSRADTSHYRRSIRYMLHSHAERVGAL